MDLIFFLVMLLVTFAFGSFLERRYILLLVLGLALIALVAWAYHRLRLAFDA